MAKKRRHEAYQEKMDETWLVPYSDILTLLLALFIVLFAAAQLDNKKFQEMAASFQSAFGGFGYNSVFNAIRTPPAVISDGRPPGPVVSGPSNLNNLAAMQEAVQLSEIKRQLDRYIAENKLEGQFTTFIGNEGLMIRIKDTALFPSGSAELLPESRRFAQVMAKMLAPLSQRVVISGHTDNVPINTPKYPSNWELSTARAVNFMKYLLAQDENLKPELFSAIGYGEYQPVADNNTPEGRAQNRRVEIMILRTYKSR